MIITRVYLRGYMSGDRGIARPDPSRLLVCAPLLPVWPGRATHLSEPLGDIRRIGVIHSTCFLGLLKGLSETVLPDLSCMLLLIVWVDAYFICVGHCLVAGVCRLQNRSLSSSCWLIRKIFLHITRASKTATSLLDLKESSQYLMWYALILPKQLLQRSTFRLQGCWSTQGLVSAIKTRMPLIFL